MKNSIRLFIITIFSISLIETQISNILWQQEMITNISQVNFVNENEAVIYSERGILAKVRTNFGDTIWKKNYIFPKKFKIKSKDQYTFAVNLDDKYVDIINNKSAELLWSFSFAGDSNVKIQAVSVNNEIIGILHANKNLYIFNDKEVISNIDIKYDILKFVIVKDILYYAIKNDNILEINSINLTYNERKNIKSVNLSSGLNLIKLTNEFCFILYNDGGYESINIVKNISSKGKIEISDNMIYKAHKNKNEIAIFNKMNLILNILDLESINLYNVDISKVKDIKYSLLGTVETDDQFFYLFRKKELNTYALDKIEDYKLLELSEFKFSDQLPSGKNTFFINPYAFNKSSIDNPIKGLLNQASFTIESSELVTYFMEENLEHENRYNTISNILHSYNFYSIPKNLLHNIYTDLIDIFFRLKSNILNVIENKIAIEKDRTKTYLIIFTISEELIIYDAINGNKLINKIIKNKTVFKIKRQSKELIYIIFKDKTKNHFYSFKFNMRTLELHEDNTILDEVFLVQEIKTISESLIYSVNSTIETELKYNLFDKFNNNYFIEISNNSINGLKIEKINKKVNLSLHWNLLLNSINLIQYKYPNINKNVITTYHSAGNVYYKYISWNTMLLISSNDKKTLIVTIINTNNGKILHQSNIYNVDTSRQINSIFEENFIVISYYKKEKSIIRNEIYVIEIMKREIEHSFVNMFEKIFKISLTGEKYNETSNDIQESDLIFLTQTYISPRNIKGIYVSKTNLNIANKYIIFLFENNQIFFIDKRGLSPRRPIMREDKSKGNVPVIDPTLNSPYTDPDITAYNPILSLDHKYVLNIDFMNDQIDDVIISTSENESVFILCTLGQNISCYKAFPDKTFDTLATNFSYSIILLFLIGIMSLVYMLRKYVKKNEIKQLFINR